MDKLYRHSKYQSTIFTLFDLSFHSESLPKKPFCSDELEKGIYPRIQRIALTKRYIQLNPPQNQHWLVFDIDRQASAFCWYDANLPSPFAVVVNPENTHCHVIYALAAPVCTSDLAHEKPLRYLAAIQHAYTEKLKADFNYSGLIAKNPFSQNHWHVIPCAIEAKYTLDELAEYVDLTQVPKRSKNASEAFALGRNCYLFDELRKFAYKEIKQYRQGKVETWRNYVYDTAMSMNVFNEPLPSNEVKSIAKSVANWVWKHMRHDSEAFRQRQSVRGQRGGIASGKQRQSKANNHKVTARTLHDEGYRVSDIARMLGVSRQIVYAWLKD